MKNLLSLLLLFFALNCCGMENNNLSSIAAEEAAEQLAQDCAHCHDGCLFVTASCIPMYVIFTDFNAILFNYGRSYIPETNLPALWSQLGLNEHELQDMLVRSHSRYMYPELELELDVRSDRCVCSTVVAVYLLSKAIAHFWQFCVLREQANPRSRTIQQAVHDLYYTMGQALVRQSRVEQILEIMRECVCSNCSLQDTVQYLREKLGLGQPVPSRQNMV